ncbi:MAG: PQQ-binding-like beta-propeller repeat protein [bacterium]|nr:PQQ-binding-like beta-propeller repeat protein [bacterium]
MAILAHTFKRVAAALLALALLWAPWPSNAAEAGDASAGITQAEEFITARAGMDRGYCLDYGVGTGALARTIAERTQLTVLGATDDPAQVQDIRRALHEQDAYGDRIVVQQADLASLPYRDYAAALVVSGSMIETGQCPGSATEMFRMVRPDGGMAIIGQPAGCPNPLERDHLEAWLQAGDVPYTIIDSAEDGLWAVVVRGPLEGAGEWTHMWADLGNTACSGDTRTSDEFEVLWFGEPGPRIMVDRHWEPVAPLYKDGRLFVPGFDRIVCCDAYNGARLWDLEVPNAARIAMMRDAGYLALDETILFVAVKGACLKVDVASGRVLGQYDLETEGRDWGYLAVDGDLLLGSTQTAGASYLAATTGPGAEGNQLGRGDYRMLITGKSLFGMERDTGRTLWAYENPEAVIANPTICAGDGAMYFLESEAEAVVAAADGRVPMADFTEGASEYLVKLDERTGELAWRVQHDVPFQHVMHLSYAHGVLVASGCTTVSDRYWYHLRAYSAADGSPLWQQDVDTTFADSDTDHGKQDKHALIIGRTVQLKHGNFDLMTGAPLGLSFSTTNCADCAASANHIFTRNKGLATVISLDEGGDGQPLCSTMRPGCYISIIPAGGIVMLPAFSAGCTCNYTIQTSIAWLPK